MKKTLFCIASLPITNVFCQVGIWNDIPRGLLYLKDNSPDANTSAGLVLPHTSDLNSIENPQQNSSIVPGTIIFDRRFYYLNNS